MQTNKIADFVPFDASDWRLGIVVAQFNKHITAELYQKAVERASQYNLRTDSIDTVSVAGSIEIPLVLQRMAVTNRYRALLALGCIIRGDTAHFDYVCRFVTDGILRVQLDYQIPIGFGVLTCNTEQQADKRIHLGGEFLDAVMHQAQAISGLAHERH